MAEEYSFKFPGTKEQFISKLERFPNNKGKIFFINDYMIKLMDDEIHFGVERAGHSGGNWFVTNFVEKDYQIEFRGRIRYIGPNGDGKKVMKILDKIAETLMFILLLPIVLMIWAYRMVSWCVRKITKRLSKKTMTAEEKLCDLMENHLDCIRILKNPDSD